MKAKTTSPHILKSTVLSVFHKALPSIRHLLSWYPLTITGSVLLFGSLYTLGASHAVRNPYGYLLSITALALIVLLAILSGIQGFRLRHAQSSWNTNALLSSRYSRFFSNPHSIKLEGFKAFPLFRIHARVKGTLRQKKQDILHVFRDYSTSSGSNGNTEMLLPIDIPMAGDLYATARVLVKDIFGFTRCQALDVHKRQITILPGLPETRIRFQAATQGAEDQKKMKSSDIERYYMREYIPGDRFRDINWKASSRNRTLFTRISPVSEEKTSIITVWIRLYSGSSRTALQPLIHADYIKSWVMAFLHEVRKEHADYIFRVLCTGEDMTLDAVDDFSRFAAFLAGIPASKAPEIPEELANAGIQEGTVYLFAMDVDPGLRQIEQFYPKISFHTHLTSKEAPKNNPARIIPLLPDFNGRDIPGIWALNPRAWVPVKQNFRIGGRLTQTDLKPVLLSEE